MGFLSLSSLPLALCLSPSLAARRRRRDLDGREVLLRLEIAAFDLGALVKLLHSLRHAGLVLRLASGGVVVRGLSGRNEMGGDSQRGGPCAPPPKNTPCCAALRRAAPHRVAVARATRRPPPAATRRRRTLTAPYEPIVTQRCALVLCAGARGGSGERGGRERARVRCHSAVIRRLSRQLGAAAMEECKGPLTQSNNNTHTQARVLRWGPRASGAAAPWPTPWSRPRPSSHRRRRRCPCPSWRHRKRPWRHH